MFRSCSNLAQKQPFVLPNAGSGVGSHGRLLESCDSLLLQNQPSLGKPCCFSTNRLPCLKRYLVSWAPMGIPDDGHRRRSAQERIAPRVRGQRGLLCLKELFHYCAIHGIDRRSRLARPAPLRRRTGRERTGLRQRTKPAMRISRRTRSRVEKVLRRSSSCRSLCHHTSSVVSSIVEQDLLLPGAYYSLSIRAPHPLPFVS